LVTSSSVFSVSASFGTVAERQEYHTSQ
jgi:hypothetical protein